MVSSRGQEPAARRAQGEARVRAAQVRPRGLGKGNKGKGDDWRTTRAKAFVRAFQGERVWLRSVDAYRDVPHVQVPVERIWEAMAQAGVPCNWRWVGGREGWIWLWPEMRREPPRVWGPGALASSTPGLKAL